MEAFKGYSNPIIIKKKEKIVSSLQSPKAKLQTIINGKIMTLLFAPSDGRI